MNQVLKSWQGFCQDNHSCTYNQDDMGIIYMRTRLDLTLLIKCHQQSRAIALATQQMSQQIGHQNDLKLVTDPWPYSHSARKAHHQVSHLRGISALTVVWWVGRYPSRTGSK